MIILIQGCRHPYRKRISENPSRFSPLLESSHDKFPVNLLIIDPIIDLSRLFIAKYTEKDLQKILKMVLKTCSPLCNGLYEKLLKARLSDV